MCAPLAQDEVVVVGPDDDDADHDAVWIFVDGPAKLSPDSRIDLWHRAVGDGDDEPDWNMCFRMKALLGDSTLRECTLSFAAMDFDEDLRSTGMIVLDRVHQDRWRDLDLGLVDVIVARGITVCPTVNHEAMVARVGSYGRCAANSSS
ncbi:hypothetical protein [Nocardia sp. NPDC049526]|uniref:hypothetical protein n=1 Tax=Nocardia sp. NPDC049526 TaxID=3364316 RepID=UPI0037A69A15